MRKLILFLLLIAAPCLANDSLAGFCEVGRGRVTTSGILSTNYVQVSYPQCTVTVYLHGTTTLATLYSDNAGTPTPLANPFQAATNGYFQAYAVNGRYDVITSAGTPFSFAAPFTRSDVLLCDPYEAGSSCVGGGGGSPGGPLHASQVNDPLGTFGGSADYGFDDDTNNFWVGGNNTCDDPVTGGTFVSCIGSNNTDVNGNIVSVIGDSNNTGQTTSSHIQGDSNSMSADLSQIVGAKNLMTAGAGPGPSSSRIFAERSTNAGTDATIAGGERDVNFASDHWMGGERHYSDSTSSTCTILGYHLGTFGSDCYSFGEGFTNSTNSSVMVGLTPFPLGVVTTTVNSGGAGYCPGDVLKLAGGHTNAIVQVTATDGTDLTNITCGAATAIQLLNAGDGYSTGTGIATDWQGCAIINPGGNQPPLDTNQSCLNLQDASLTVDIATVDTDATNKGPEIQVTSKAVNLPYSLTVQGVPVGGAGLASGLPTCDSTTEGGTRGVTDSTTATWGNTVTGTGSNHVLAYCNGTNWTVAAK